MRRIFLVEDNVLNLKLYRQILELQGFEVLEEMRGERAVERIRGATGAPDADYDAVAELFDPREQVLLTLLVSAINSWNRIAIGFRTAHPVSETTTGANAA